jgi:uncharacterized membrane protein affecting hemolysin expression
MTKKTAIFFICIVLVVVIAFGALSLTTFYAQPTNANQTGALNGVQTLFNQAVRVESINPLETKKKKPKGDSQPFLVVKLENTMVSSY